MTDTPTFLQEPVPTGLAEYEATAREFVKELHPLAQAFPVVTGTAFEEIKASIWEHGQIHAIILYEGKVLDGVTRQRILQELGLKPRYEVLPANIDPIDYVIAANLRRRQLTPAQRALIGAKLAALQRGDNQHSSRELPSQAAIAEKLDVSISSIKRARTIKATGATAVLEAVETGALDLTAGAAIAKAPIVEQPALVEAATVPQRERQPARAPINHETRDARAHVRHILGVVGGVASHLEKKKGDFTPLFKKLEARIKEMGTLDNKERNAALHSLREDLEAYINAYEPAPAPVAAFAMLHRIYAKAQDQEDFWPPFGPENDQAIQDFLVQLEKTLDAAKRIRTS